GWFERIQDGEVGWHPHSSAGIVEIAERSHQWLGLGHQNDQRRLQRQHQRLNLKFAKSLSNPDNDRKTRSTATQPDAPSVGSETANAAMSSNGTRKTQRG